MKLQRLSEPFTYSISLAEIKNHLRILDSDNDSYLLSLLPVSTAYCETILGRRLISQQWRLWLDGWQRIIKLPFPPVITVDAIKYYDLENTLQTLPITDYETDLIDEPAKVKLLNRPAVINNYNAAYIDFTCGYGEAGSDVPSPIRQALLMLIGHYYMNRQDILVSFGGGPPIALTVPKAADALLNLHAVGEYLIT